MTPQDKYRYAHLSGPIAHIIIEPKKGRFDLEVADEMNNCLEE